MIQTTTNERSVLRWLTVAIVIATVICLVAIVRVQSHYYNAALKDVRVLSSDALKEVRAISDEQIKTRNVRFDAVDGKLAGLEHKLDAIIERAR